MMNKKAELVRVVVLILLVSTVLGPIIHQIPPVKADPGWLAGWDKRVKIMLDSGDIDATLSNFPVLIYLSDSCGINSEDITFVFDEVGANRKKIAVTTSDGTTECYVEVEKWDLGNEKAWLWVKVPSVASGADTDLYLYFDGDHADNDAHVGDPSDAVTHNVWDGNYALVTHMRDDPDASHVRDSTEEANDGTKKGVGEPAATAAGMIDDAQHFDADDDYISVANDASLDLATVTITGWVNLDTTGTRRMVYINNRASVSTADFHIFLEITDSNKLRIFWGDGIGSEGFTSTGTFDTNWHFFAVVRNNTSKELTFQIDVAGEAAEDYTVVPQALGAYDIWIGISNIPGYPLPMDGIFDDIRVSSTTRNAAWLDAVYETGRDHLNDFGSEETLVPVTHTDTYTTTSCTTTITSTTGVVSTTSTDYTSLTETISVTTTTSLSSTSTTTCDTSISSSTTCTSSTDSSTSSTTTCDTSVSSSTTCHTSVDSSTSSTTTCDTSISSSTTCTSSTDYSTSSTTTCDTSVDSSTSCTTICDTSISSSTTCTSSTDYSTSSTTTCDTSTYSSTSSTTFCVTSVKSSTSSTTTCDTSIDSSTSSTTTCDTSVYSSTSSTTTCDTSTYSSTSSTTFCVTSTYSSTSSTTFCVTSVKSSTSSTTTCDTTVHSSTSCTTTCDTTVHSSTSCTTTCDSSTYSSTSSTTFCVTSVKSSTSSTTTCDTSISTSESTTTTCDTSIISSTSTSCITSTVTHTTECVTTCETSTFTTETTTCITTCSTTETTTSTCETSISSSTSSMTLYSTSTDTSIVSTHTASDISTSTDYTETTTIHTATDIVGVVGGGWNIIMWPMFGVVVLFMGLMLMRRRR